jgi:hypothetical protein
VLLVDAEAPLLAVTAEVLAARVRTGDMAALRQIGDRFEFAHATLP